MKRIKKLTSVFLAAIIALSVLTVAPFTVSAATYGNFEYTLESDYTCTITKYNGYASNVTIPSTIYGNKVTKIGWDSFEKCENLVSVTIPNSVIKIDGYAFSGCSNLNSIVFSNNLKEIGGWAFEGCKNLTSVRFPDSLTDLGKSAFEDCEKLVSVTINNGLININNYAFYNCKSLTSISVPNSVKKIGDQVFENCTSLKNVSIGYGAENVSTYYSAFKGCSSLETISVNSNNKKYCSIDGILYNKNKTEILWYPQGKKSTSYTVPNTVTFLGTNTTNNNPYLKTITIYDNVTGIDNNAVGYINDGWNYKKVNGFTIKGYKGTEAERYARNNDFNFIEIPKPINPTKISLSKSSLSLAVGGGATLTTTIQPSNATKTLTWSSSNPSVAYVYSNGYVYAQNPGTVTITAKTINGLTATCKVTVNTATPKITRLENTVDGIKLSWNAVTGAYGYRVYYKNSKGEWKRFSKDTTATTFTDTAVTAGKKETYTIRCVDRYGNTISGYNSTGWSITYQYPCPSPYVKTISNTAGGIKLSWSAVPGAYAYRVYYKNSKGEWKSFSKDTTASTFTDSAVSPGRYETYTVRCVNRYGKLISSYNTKGWSLKYQPVAPTLSLYNTSNGIRISWKKIAGVDRYRVYYKNSSGNWVRFKNDIYGTSMLDTGVKVGRMETYTIRCVDKNGNLVSGYNPTGWSITYRKS